MSAARACIRAALSGELANRRAAAAGAARRTEIADGECEVGGGRFATALRRAIASVKRYGREVWNRDRSRLHGWAAVWTRLARILFCAVRGVRAHKLSLQAAALAYYTLFTIVPVLVVALWVLKLFHLIHYLMPDVPSPPEATARGTMPEIQVREANLMLRTALRAILSAVDRAGHLETGIVGLAALLYGVIRQIVHVEVALNTIAASRDRPHRHWRLFGYLALLALPPSLLIVSGLLRRLSRVPVADTVARAMSWLLAALPLLRSTIAVAIGLTILCLTLAIFYGSAVRVRMRRLSTFAGAAVGALLLAGVLWAFAHLQIGASRAGALQSGMAAIPVFLLWAFSSWLVVLIGAEVAVAHELDGILIHGARVWRLDPYEEQMAGVQIMVEATQEALSAPGAVGHDGATTTNELARRLRLLPESVREVAARLRTAGLLRRLDGDDYRLACDPDVTSLRDVVGAVIGRPEQDLGARPGRNNGPTLRVLAARDAAPPGANRDSAP
jgi:membrane protein